LIFDHFYGDKLTCFVIFALQNLAKCTFADELKQLESVADLVSSNDTVVTFLVVKTVIDKSFQLCWLVLVRCKIENILVFGDLSLFVAAQKGLYGRIKGSFLASEGKFDLIFNSSLIFKLDKAFFFCMLSGWPSGKLTAHFWLLIDRVSGCVGRLDVDFWLNFYLRIAARALGYRCVNFLD
jgi:hypothetical protein